MGHGASVSLPSFKPPPDETAPDYFPILGVSIRFLHEIVISYADNAVIIPDCLILGGSNQF